jgi:ribosome-binding protein aMBF1 (putative translation factor)
MKRTRSQPDFLDELIETGSRQKPDFRNLIDAAVDRRELLRQLVRRREALGLSQRDVAAKMGTSQPAVARLESGEVDARGSTIERFATAVGRRIEYRLARKPRRRSAALARA